MGECPGEEATPVEQGQTQASLARPPCSCSMAGGALGPWEQAATGPSWWPGAAGGLGAGAGGRPGEGGSPPQASGEGGRDGAQGGSRSLEAAMHGHRQGVGVTPKY